MERSSADLLPEQQVCYIGLQMSKGGVKMPTGNVCYAFPPGFEKAVQMTREELDRHIRLMAALKMFELGKISSGKAAELAGMSHAEFLETCGVYHVSVFNYSAEDAKEELRKDVAQCQSLAR